MSEGDQPCLPSACISLNRDKGREVLKRLHYIGVEFDEQKIRKKACEDEINVYLSKGYQPIRDIDTPIGCILVMGLYGPESNIELN